MPANEIDPDLRALAEAACHLAPGLERVSVRTKDSKSVLLIQVRGEPPLQRATFVAALEAFRTDHNLDAEFLVVHVEQNTLAQITPTQPEEPPVELTA